MYSKPFFLFNPSPIGRIKAGINILDEATRNRRQRKALDALEKDNFQDHLPSPVLNDYRANINKKLHQSFSVVNEGTAAVTRGEEPTSTGIGDEGTAASRKRKLKPEAKLRFRKNFATLIEEEHTLAADKKFNYFSVCVAPSRFPARKLCAVCGFNASYTCVQCGTRYCTSQCLQTHKDTR